MIFGFFRRFGFGKFKSSLDAITSVSQIEEDFSDDDWEYADFQDRFDK